MKQSSQLFHDSIDNTANQRVTAQTPLDIMEEYNGCSVPQYARYPWSRPFKLGVPLKRDSNDSYEVKILQFNQRC